jgi:hypothetical protein
VNVTNIWTPSEELAPPEHPIVVEHRSQLILLLREAAELEHAIMCQYLFAAFTMKQRVEEGLTLEQLEAVTHWRKVILEVARQEMLHLALVQNLLTSIGAGPHLSRPNIPSPARYFPPGVRLALLPFGEQALRHFLFLERPEGMPMDDVEGLEAVERARAPIRDDDIVPSPQEYGTVGHLYRAIDIGFAWLTAQLGESRLFVGPPESQATSAAFGWAELVSVTNLDAAHRAIDTVVEQGEGVRGEWRTAHFGRFLGVLDEYMAMRQADPSFEPSRPVLAGTVRPSEDVPTITDPAAAQLADLFNVANEIILLVLTRYFAHTDESEAQVKTLSNIGVGLMFTAIRPLGLKLTTLPFGPSHPGLNAAPTFELFYRIGYMLPHRQAAWLLIEERLRQAAEFARRIDAQWALGIEKVAAAMDGYADRLAST